MVELHHFIINSADATDRRNNMIETCKQLGLSPRFFPAVMGNQFTREQLQQVADDKGILTPGEVGCALSHLSIYKQLLKTDKKCIFVFEDDINIRSDFSSLVAPIEEFMSNQTEGAVLLLYQAKARTKTIQAINDSSVHILRSLAGSTAHGYVINRIAAENILQAQTPVLFEIDAWAQYVKLNYLNLYCLDEDVVFLNTQLSTNSLIDAIGARNSYSGESIKKIKDESFKRLLSRLSWKERCVVEYKRIQRHINEHFYEDRR